MGQKQEEKQEKMSIDEKVEALHAWEAGEGFEPTDFAGDDGEVERRYAQLMGLPVPE